MKHCKLISRYFSVFILLIFSKLSFAQKDTNFYIETDTTFKVYRGSIGEDQVYMFLQNVNDTLSGYYFYYKIGINIKLTGFYRKDSVFFSEYGKGNVKTAIMKGKVYKTRYSEDTIGGIWTDLKTTKEYKLRIYSVNHLTGDVYKPKINEYNIVFRNNDKKFKFPIAKYLDKKFNYHFGVYIMQKTDSNFCAVIDLYNYRNPENSKKNKDFFDSFYYERYRSKIDQNMVYIKFKDSGEIDTVLKILISSEYIELKQKFRKNNDTIEFDVLDLNRNQKTNVFICKSEIDKGFKIKKSRFFLQVPLFLYDTVSILDYQLKIRYRYQIPDNSPYLPYISEYTKKPVYKYQIDKITEANYKDISKIKEVCDYITENMFTNFGDDYLYTKPMTIGIEMMDYNFDGYDDMTFHDWISSGAHNRAYPVWLYNPKSGRYEYSYTFYNPSLDEKNKIVTENWSYGAFDFEDIDYKYIKNEYVKTRFISVSKPRSDSEKGEIITRELINGKWLEKTEEY